MSTAATPSEPSRWLLLIHQTPPKPDYLRVKIGRRLQKIGAVAIKNTVYVLPRTDGTLEDFQWTVREIESVGGDATLAEARLVDGMKDEQVEALFNAARTADYEQLGEEARQLVSELGNKKHLEERLVTAEASLSRLRRRLDEIAAIDFFHAPVRKNVDAVLAELEKRIHPRRHPSVPSVLADFQGRTWVTRAGIHVDRIACAWLIKRFIDADARFRFVSPRTYEHARGELRFDMSEAEFTHEGDMCSFEVLVERMHLNDAALHDLAEIIHELDVKDGKFGRTEAPGVGALINGIALAHRSDEERLARGSAVLNDLYAFFDRRARGGDAD